MFLKEELVKYQDLSSDIIRGINRINKDGKYFFVELQINEQEDRIKKEQILPYLNDDLWVTCDLHR